MIKGMYHGPQIYVMHPNHDHVNTACMCSGVGSNHMLWGPLVQVVGVALVTEFYD